MRSLTPWRVRIGAGPGRPSLADNPGSRLPLAVGAICWECVPDLLPHLAFSRSSRLQCNHVVFVPTDPPLGVGPRDDGQTRVR
jgi:hypothetical protein